MPEEYEVAVNDQVWVDHKKSFPAGTVITNLVPVVEGYDLTPSSVASVTMDADKTLSFTAVSQEAYVPIIGGEVSDSTATITGNNVDYTGPGRTRHDIVNTGGTSGGIRSKVGPTGGMGLGANDSSFAARNDMFFGYTREGNGKVVFFSLGDNLYETTGVPDIDVIVEIKLFANDWKGYIDGVEVISITSIPGNYKPNTIGFDGGYLHDMESLNFV